MQSYSLGSESLPSLGDFVPAPLTELVARIGDQKAVPTIARSQELSGIAAEAAARSGGWGFEFLRARRGKSLQFWEANHTERAGSLRLSH